MNCYILLLLVRSVAQELVLFCQILMIRDIYSAELYSVMQLETYVILDILIWSPQLPICLKCQSYQLNLSIWIILIPQIQWLRNQESKLKYKLEKVLTILCPDDNIPKLFYKITTFSDPPILGQISILTQNGAYINRYKQFIKVS